MQKLDDELTTPLDYISPEDTEKDINDRFYAARPKSDQDSETEDPSIKKPMLSSKSRSRMLHPKEGLGYSSEKGDAFVDFAKAKAQIEELKDELMQDYLKDNALMEANKVLEKQLLKANKGTKEREHITSLINDKTQLPYDKVVLEYPAMLPDEQEVPEYPRKLSDDETIPEYAGKLPEDKAIPEYAGKVADDEATTHENHGELDDKAVLEYSRKLPDNKAVSEYYKKLLNDKTSTYKGQLAPRNGNSRPKALNSLDRSNKTDHYSTEQLTDFHPRQQNHESQPSSFDTMQNKNANLDYRHQLGLALASRGKQIQAKELMDGHTLNPDDDLWTENIAPSALTEQGTGSSSVGMSRLPDTSSSKTFGTISNISQENGNNMFAPGNPPNKTQVSPQDRFEKNLNIFLKKAMLDEKARKQDRINNQTVLIPKSEQIDDNDGRRHGVSGSSRQKSVSPLRKQTDGTNRREHAEHKDTVSVEKRRGNMAAKYRQKNKKTHRKQKPQPQPQPVMRLDTTSQSSSTSTDTLTNLTENTSRWTTLGLPNRTMEEIIDAGSDKIDIPLSGTPSWHTLIHGRRDIVLAGAIMGGIGILLIILSIIYMLVNRRSSQQKTNKNNSKAYQRLGTEDEKVRLTKTKRSLFPLSSEEDTSGESDEDTEQHQVKKKKAAHY